MSDIQPSSANPLLDHFNDSEMVLRYLDGPRRFVPGLDDLLKMTLLLLAERAPANAKVLVLGAGGGSELLAMAEAQPGWAFVGVDPASEMLKLAERTASAHMDRIELIEGCIDNAPVGPFDAATCLLTLHFMDAAERERTLRLLHSRLRPNAPFVAAHIAFPQEENERGIWLDRYAAFAVANGVDPEMARNARDMVAANLHCLNPEQDEAILRTSGFADVDLFYSAFTWRGWTCRA
jgi:tRNA (cmo5U34)-methyltransferase